MAQAKAIAKKVLQPNATNVLSIIKDPVKFAGEFLSTYDTVKTETTTLEQSKVDLKEAYTQQPGINEKLICGDRAVQVETKTLTSYEPITLEALKAVTKSSADVAEVTVTSVDPTKVKQMAERFITRGQKEKGEALLALVKANDTSQQSVAVRKAPVSTLTTQPVSNPNPSATPIEKAVVTIV